MELFQNEPVVTKITAALFVPAGGGTPIHTNRKAHGLAFNTEHTTTYRFFDGTVLTCHSGQCIYLPKGANYTVECAPAEQDTAAPAGSYAINFLFMDPSITDEPFLIQPRGRDRILSCFTRAESAWRQKPAGFQEECYSALYQLLRLFRRELATYSQLDGILAKIAPALQFIDANYPSQTISLPHLASLCNMSEPHLRKLFNAAFSVSPAIYVRNLRLNYAKELLRTGEYSITSVAMLAGFNSTNYFAREFKKATGLSPSDYRLK